MYVFMLCRAPKIIIQPYENIGNTKYRKKVKPYKTNIL